MPGLTGTVHIQPKYEADMEVPGHARHVLPDSSIPSQIATNPPRRPVGFICYLLSSSSSTTSISCSAAAPAPQPFPGSPLPAPKEPFRPHHGGRGRQPERHRGKTMDSDASSDEEYGPTELDKIIQDEFFDSSESDGEVDMEEKMDQQVEHILNIKGEDNSWV